jgi:hypothetical protein
MKSVSSQVGPESNPLVDSINFSTWAICLPRWILKTRSDFAWHLRRSLSFSAPQRSQLSTTVFPLPAPPMPVRTSKGFPKLSKRRLLKLCRARLLHVTVLALNFVYLGRYPTSEELGRKANPSQTQVFQRLRALLTVCGSSDERFPFAPGRSGPELAACVFQLEDFASRVPEMQRSYLERPIRFFKNPHLLPHDDYPQLSPYRSLDVSRLKLVGEGHWDMSEFLEGPLWLPFLEPAILRHGLPVDESCAPRFDLESREECLKLVRLWDSKGLAELFDSPIEENMFCRCFNAFKDLTKDRQIGDRRMVNMSEMAFDGPSKFLPPGPLLVQLKVRRFREKLVASITDRRDFYHQAKVSLERCQSNLLPFSYALDELQDLKALEKFCSRADEKTSTKREVVGDKLGFSQKHGRAVSLPERLFPGFSSLFQGDHLGVEFALCAHQVLLERNGLLINDQQIKGHHGFPTGPLYSGLVIDDFFLIGREAPALCRFTLPLPRLWLKPERSMVPRSSLARMKRTLKLKAGSRLPERRFCLTPLPCLLDVSLLELLLQSGWLWLLFL